MRARFWRFCTALAAALASVPVGPASAAGPDPQDPVLGDTVQVLPGPGIPPDAPLMRANNNLDIADVEGARFMAVRTAVFHWASPFTRLVVLRSDDAGATWHTEAVLDRGRDMREPRFLALDGRLFLYFFEAGTNPLAFEPGRIFGMQRTADGTWEEPRAVSDDDYVAWRTKTVGGVPYMLRYHGGGDSYSAGEAAIDIELMTTTDGYEWTPVDAGRPVVHTGGGSEADFAFDRDGALWAVVRNEGGEKGRFGSLLCTAPPGDPASWSCSYDKRKFDSPLVFSRDGGIWLLARRQVAFGGNYELAWSWLPRDLAYLLNEAAYWFTPKRLSLWRVDTEEHSVSWVLDLPSRGDTAFPAITWLSQDRLVVYNYSSPLEGPDLPWVAGQLGPTAVYATEITFPT